MGSGKVIKSSRPKPGVSMKFRPSAETGRASAKGTKPLAEAASVQHILMMMIVHLSRKLLYGLEMAHRVGIYIVGVLVLSVIGDFSGESRSFFADKTNFINVYLVKLGLGWTLSILVPFVVLTSYTYGCGKEGVMRSSLTRLAINTVLIMTFTSIFDKIEEMSGICSATKLPNKSACNGAGHKWKGFDISGHCFLLISCNLVILEEAKAYLGWERIKDLLRNEEHKRLSTELPDQNYNADEAPTVLSKLTLDEFLHLRTNYAQFTKYVRMMFCLMSVLVLIWDLMLFNTVLYFHMMIEKVIATCLAVLMWFALYRGILTQTWSSGLPGQNGPFRYVTFKSKVGKEGGLQRKGSLCRQHRDQKPKDENVPKFMGMPIYGLETKPKTGIVLSNEEPPMGSHASRRSSADYGKLRSRSRSVSQIRSSHSKSSLNFKS